MTLVYNPHPLERFHREIRRGTKVRDHQFPKPKSVLKLIYLESERYNPKSPFVGRWERRRLRHFADAGEALMEMFACRYSLTQKWTHKILMLLSRTLKSTSSLGSIQPPGSNSHNTRHYSFGGVAAVRSYRLFT